MKRKRYPPCSTRVVDNNRERKGRAKPFLLLLLPPPPPLLLLLFFYSDFRLFSREQPVVRLSLPGTHDSFCRFGLSTTSAVCFARTSFRNDRRPRAEKFAAGGRPVSVSSSTTTWLVSRTRRWRCCLGQIRDGLNGPLIYASGMQISSAWPFSKFIVPRGSVPGRFSRTREVAVKRHSRASLFRLSPLSFPYFPMAEKRGTALRDR